MEPNFATKKATTSGGRPLGISEIYGYYRLQAQNRAQFERLILFFRAFRLLSFGAGLFFFPQGASHVGQPEKGPESGV